MRITINGGATFLISDDLGNILDGTELGLYHEDTRFLSAYTLTLDGEPPLVLAAHSTAPFASAHFLTNPILPAIPRGQLSIIRRRLLGDGMREELEFTNHSEGAVACDLDLWLDADFCHLFDAKHEAQASKESLLRGGTVRRESAPDGREIRFFYSNGPRVRTLLVHLSAPSDTVDGRCRFALRLAPQQSWRLTLDFVTLLGERTDEQQAPAGASALPPGAPTQRGAAARERSRQHQERIVASAPVLQTDSLILRRAYRQSVQDFAALQILPTAATTAGQEGAHPEEAVDSRDEFIIAAGIPWYMTLFGRDSLITAYQALPYFPAAAKGTLRALARLQGTRVDMLRAEEPGKILHEYRSPTFTGFGNSAAMFPYYGTIDATPLFLQLLADVYRVTGDMGLARELREPALRALDWMARYGDRDGDGYLEYLREAEVGLENQGWKDSGDALRHRDGRLAQPPIALCEVQGYAYAARVGMSEVFAALGETTRAERLAAEAAELKVHFNRDFWMEERGCFAFALDGAKHQVDALTSNAGQVLWSGIADVEKARVVAKRLVAPELFSGWGVRTMATTEGGYNPISYHNGSVWPHDTSLIVAGLARYGCVDEARRIAAGMFAALDYSPDGRLPELFAGYSSTEAPFPVEYPTACRPQAWAAGSILLLLSVMAGIDPSARAGANVAFLPETTGHVHMRGTWVGSQQIEVDVRRDGETATRTQAPFAGARHER